MSFKPGDIVYDVTDLGEKGDVVFVDDTGYWIKFDCDNGTTFWTFDYAHRSFKVVGSSKKLTLKPDEEWVPHSASCTCGITAIGGGVHSGWCDLADKVS